MSHNSGMECEVCDNPIILFSREKEDDNEGTVITVDCQKCHKTHELGLDDLVADIPFFCCDLELLPNEYDEDLDDFYLDIVCCKCGAENEVSVDMGLYFLAVDEMESRIELY